jgi:hypothetical protein
MAKPPIEASFEFPRFFDVKFTKEVPKELQGTFRDLVRALEKMHRELVRVMNLNRTAITFISQNAQPTPLAGEVWLWEDADATSGNPTHYLVANDGVSVVTFASAELVP